jgi:hypothetical protein
MSCWYCRCRIDAAPEAFTPSGVRQASSWRARGVPRLGPLELYRHALRRGHRDGHKHSSRRRGVLLNQGVTRDAQTSARLSFMGVLARPARWVPWVDATRL